MQFMNPNAVFDFQKDAKLRKRAERQQVQGTMGSGINPLFKGGAGAGGGEGLDIKSLLAQLTKGSNDANAANEQRYQQLLSGSNDRKSQALGYLNGLGNTEGQLIQERGQQQIAQSNADLTGRGLGNTTIRQSNQQGINRNTQFSQSDLAERVAQQKLSTLDRIDQERLGFIERRTDSGPDINALLPLLLQQAMAQSSKG